MEFRRMAWGFAAMAGLALLAGCPAGKTGAKKEEAKGTLHAGWWCDEHGIPEKECSLCSPKAAADFKKKGDWCALHERAKSQCFVCDPSLRERFAAIYRAKEGKDPPPIEEETKDKK